MSAQDYDSHLLESVSVRRRRLRDAVLFGAQRQQRSVDERLGKVFAGVAIAAVPCAGRRGMLDHLASAHGESARAI